MHSHHYFPNPRLAPFIRHYLLIESEEGMENFLLPDTHLVMAFRFRGEVHRRTLQKGESSLLPAAVVSGLQSSIHQVRYTPGAATLLVVFRPGGSAAFFAGSQQELQDQSIALSDAKEFRHWQEIPEQLSEAATDADRIALLETYLLRHLAAKEDPLVLYAVQQIEQNQGMMRIDALMTSLAISRDAFEKRFRRYIGTTPKQFATTIRLRHLIGQQRLQAQSFTELAYTSGYFDQSHFIKEFKHFTGQTPTRFFQLPRVW